MKPFDELTDDELAELTDEQVSLYIDLRSAEEGVPLLPETAPVAPDEALTPSPQIEVFQVSAEYFTDRAEAEAVRDAIRRAKSRVGVGYVGNDYRQKKIKRDSDAVEISTSLAHDEATAERLRNVLAEATRRRDSYEAERREYDLVLAKRDKVFKPIQQAVSDARARNYQRQRIRSQHARYLQLADGNRRIAARFLESARSDARELCPELFTFTPADPPDPSPKARQYQEDDDAAVQQPIGVGERAADDDRRL